MNITNITPHLLVIPKTNEAWVTITTNSKVSKVFLYVWNPPIIQLAWLKSLFNMVKSILSNLPKDANIPKELVLFIYNVIQQRFKPSIFLGRSVVYNVSGFLNFISYFVAIRKEDVKTVEKTLHDIIAVSKLPYKVTTPRRFRGNPDIFIPLFGIAPSICNYIIKSNYTFEIQCKYSQTPIIDDNNILKMFAITPNEKDILLSFSQEREKAQTGFIDMIQSKNITENVNIQVTKKLNPIFEKKCNDLPEKIGKKRALLMQRTKK
jgi:hypothetical protein